MSPGVDIEASGIRRAFGSKVVLAGLDIAAAPGEFVVVVGRSGCGKSTLLRLLAGLDKPDDGEVRVGGEPLRGLYPAARVVFQDGRLLPWLRVGANVALGLSSRETHRAAEVLAEVGLAERSHDWPAILSGGQRQRVALARALAASPRLLLLDEPLGSLDALTRLEMQRLLERLWQRAGFTSVLITHDVEEAVALGNRVIHLANGRVLGEWVVDLPRPRPRGNAQFTELVQHILETVMRIDQGILR